MQFYRFTSSGEQGPTEVPIDWEKLSSAERHSLYHDLRSGGGGVRLQFEKEEVQKLKDLRIIDRTTPLLDEAMGRDSFESFCLQSPPEDADTRRDLQPFTPVAMVKYRGVRYPMSVNIGGVSTNELGDLLFSQEKTHTSK